MKSEIKKIKYKMNWKIKVRVGEVVLEAEMPLTERTDIKISKDGTAGKTVDIIKELADKAAEISSGMPKKIDQQLNS